MSFVEQGYDREAPTAARGDVASRARAAQRGVRGARSGSATACSSPGAPGPRSCRLRRGARGRRGTGAPARLDRRRRDRATGSSEAARREGDDHRARRRTATGSRRSGWSRWSARRRRHARPRPDGGHRLEGDFTAAHTDGDNADVVATDTMKNTVYALAPRAPHRFDRAVRPALARHHLGPPQVARARSPLGSTAGAGSPTAAVRPHDAFVRSGELTRTTLVVGRAATARDGRLGDRGPDRDEDRRGRRSPGSRATSTRRCPRSTTGSWPRGSPRTGGTQPTPRTRLRLDARSPPSATRCSTSMAEHHSPSVQASIWIIGQGDPRAPCRAVDEVTMRLPNLHHWLVDLSPVRRCRTTRDLRRDHASRTASSRRRSADPPDHPRGGGAAPERAPQRSATNASTSNRGWPRVPETTIRIVCVPGVGQLRWKTTWRASVVDE